MHRNTQKYTLLSNMILKLYVVLQKSKNLNNSKDKNIKKYN